MHAWLLMYIMDICWMSALTQHSFLLVVVSSVRVEMDGSGACVPIRDKHMFKEIFIFTLNKATTLHKARAPFTSPSGDLLNWLLERVGESRGLRLRNGLRSHISTHIKGLPPARKVIFHFCHLIGCLL